MKKNYASLALFCALFFGCPFLSSGQSLADRYFKGWGVSAFDVFRRPVNANHYNSSSESVEDFSVFLISASYNQRLNLFEMSSNSSISADLPLIAGYGLSGLSFVAPLTFNFNVGNVSTYNTDNNKGFTIGAGAEYIFLSRQGLGNAEVSDSPVSWIQPVGNIGYRFWGKANKAREINLKVGYGSSSALIKETSQSAPYNVTQPTMSVRLSFVQYINY